MSKLKTLEEIAAMPIGIEPILELQALYHERPNVIHTPEWIRFTIRTSLGRFLTGPLPQGYLDQMKIHFESLHKWEREEDSFYKERCSICGEQRDNPDRKYYQDIIDNAKENR
jgi:hypothetical protein